MELYSGLYPYIQPYMTGAIRAVIIQSVKVAARKYCRDTDGWRSTHTQNSDKDVLTYSFSLDTYDAIMSRVVSVRINNSDSILTEDDYTVSDDRESIVLKNYPSSSEASGIEIIIAMIPEYNAEQLSYPFFDRWSEGILAGAKAEMYRQPLKPYTDLNQYMLCLRDYKISVGNCMRENFKQARTVKNIVNRNTAIGIWN